MKNPLQIFMLTGHLLPYRQGFRRDGLKNEWRPCAEAFRKSNFYRIMNGRQALQLTVVAGAAD
jgi:hypothetical protein